ncbi:hypothetical protein FZX15_15680 [Brucella suis bv. 1]|nr:hypothetical protein FZX15_15680 [Brucella suis bv. 1]
MGSKLEMEKRRHPGTREDMPSAHAAFPYYALILCGRIEGRSRMVQLLLASGDYLVIGAIILSVVYLS